MARPKIPRKSTAIDMTAMCDVAFLLLSFFILTTKFKPSESITIDPPGSVAKKPAPEKDVVLISITSDGKVFLSMDDAERKEAVLNNVNASQQLGLSDAQIKQLVAQDFYGVAFNQLSQQAAFPKDKLNGNNLPGIVCKDSTNNEMIGWMGAVVTAYMGGKINLVLKGDNSAKYPAFKNVIAAFKKNDLLKFQMVTSPLGVPKGTELYNLNMAGKFKEEEEGE